MGLLVHTRVYRPTFPNSFLLSTAINHGNNVTNNQALKGNKEANQLWTPRLKEKHSSIITHPTEEATQTQHLPIST